MSLNKVMIIGRLGQEPELRYTSGGSPVCTLNLATSETWNDKNSGQKQERTEWHRVVVWGKLAELCNQYLAKGRQAYVEGKLQTRAWDDKDGNKRYTTEINASTVQFLGGQSSASSGNNSYDQSMPAQEPATPFKVEPDPTFAADDIPF